MAGSLMRSKNNVFRYQPFAGMTTSITGIGTVITAVLKVFKSTCQPLGADDSALMMFITVPVVTS